ncbi:MAG TPA: C39 family peptidase [Dehalococcoidia bacterium]|nr:C39 family peptidase [Dehalococcoidia bacterium]
MSVTRERQPGGATSLCALVSGLDPAVVRGAVPPACRGPLTAHGAEVRIEGSDALISTPAWAVEGATHLLPSLSALGAVPAVRLELSVRIGDGWSPWVAGVTLGGDDFAPLPAADGALTVDVDVFQASRPAAAVRVRVRVAARDLPALRAMPWMLTLSASAAPGAIAPSAAVGAIEAGVPSAPTRTASAAAVTLDVPAWTQMKADPAIALRICSPTSVGMVLAYHGRVTDLEGLAARIYHAGLDRYGVWPAAIRAAGEHGLLGYLLRVPGWDAVAWYLDHGLPVIASIRYRAGELAGAAVPETTGHLIVVRGYEGGDVLVNDPAGPSVDTVPRRYRREELLRAWLGGSAVGYVLFPPRDPGPRHEG